MNKNILLLMLASLMLSAFVMVISDPGIIGMAVYDTFEDGMKYRLASGVYMSDIPGIRVDVGHKVKLQVEASEGVVFTDDTNLFNITQEGEIEFIAKEEDIGYHRVFVIAKKGREFNIQDMRIIIED